MSNSEAFKALRELSEWMDGCDLKHRIAFDALMRTATEGGELREGTADGELYAIAFANATQEYRDSGYSLCPNSENGKHFFHENICQFCDAGEV